MALLKRIMHPNLNSAGSNAEYIDKLSEWQQVVRVYERISGKELDQTVKTATLIEEAPAQMQEHLRLRSEEIGTDYKKVILAIEGCMCSKKTWDSRGPVDVDVGAVKKGKGQPEGKARARAKVRKTRAKDGPQAREKAMSLRTKRISTPVCVIKEPGHSLGHVYNQNTSVRHNGILLHTVEIHSCSHYTASNMKPTVDSGAAIHNFHHFVHPRNICHSKVLVECCIILGVKLRVMCIEVSHFK